MKKESLKKRLYTSLVLVLLLVLTISYNFFLLLSLIIFFVISILEFINLTRKVIQNKILLNLSNLIFIFYISHIHLFFYFTNFIQLKIIAFTLLISCIVSDIGDLFLQII